MYCRFVRLLNRVQPSGLGAPAGELVPGRMFRPISSKSFSLDNRPMLSLMTSLELFTGMEM